MYLIERNKIANYIKEHPEVQTSFLVWLKEFPYREARRLVNHEESAAQQNITVESQFGNSNYKIRYRTNSFLNTAYIDWVGTADEFSTYIQNDLKNRQALYPDTKIGHIKITRVTLKPPDFDELIRTRQVVQTDKIATDQAIETIAEYEAGLARAIRIFDAAPSTPEGLELATLIPRLVHYENRFIPFPELDPLTVIKLKMQEWGIVDQYPLDLINLIGSQDELAGFLSGQKPLTKQALAVFYNYLKIDFMDS